MILQAFYKALAMYATGVAITVPTPGGSTSTSMLTASSCYKLFCLKNAFQSVVSNTSSSGIVVGSGTTPPTFNDNSLKSQITTITGNVSFGTSIGTNQDFASITAIVTITNTGDKAITVAEIGAQINVTGNWCWMVDRTVLDNPITIEPGGIGQVTYTIRLDYPTE